MAIIHELIGAGFHFGHHSSRWNPKMKPYIFGKKDSIHIINLKETVKGIITACKLLTRLASNNGTVLFVGTKWQARQLIEEEAKRCNMHYITERWLGGTLTNFGTIRKSLKHLEELERLEDASISREYSKKLLASLNREKKKIKRNLEGVRNMNKLPDALIVIDPKNEIIAVKEANKLGIPTIGLADTDCDPELLDICVPGNDDAMRAIKFFLNKIGDAILEGKANPVNIPKGKGEQSLKNHKLMTTPQEDH